MDIEPLLIRIAAGDKQAYAAIVAHYQRPLFGFLGRMALGRAQAEDVAQEAFLRAWHKLGDYRPASAAFSTWLFTIARNLALNELERAARHQPPSGQEAEAECGAPQPPEALARRQRQARLHAVLRTLPLADRSALALAYIEELDLDAVARIEGCTAGAIKTRLHRAREKLRAMLELEEHDG